MPRGARGVRLRQRLRRGFRLGGERWRSFFGQREDQAETRAAADYPEGRRTYLWPAGSPPGAGSWGGSSRAPASRAGSYERSNGRARGAEEAGRRPVWVSQSLAALVIFTLAVAYTHSGLPGQAQLRTGVTRLVTSDYDFAGLLTRLPSWDSVKNVFGPGALTRIWWHGDTGGNTGGNPAGTDSGQSPTGGGTVLRMVAPVPGAISSGFGWRTDPKTKKEEFHPGLDLKGNSGDLILAAAAGKVLHVGNDPTGYGKWLEIDHGNGITTIYGHTSEILVKEKDVVKQGQVIAKVGQTGAAQGPHLHFEVRRNGEVLDPSPALGLAQGS